MNKFCPNCGSELAEGQIFCANCGKELVEQPIKKNKNYSTYTIITGIVMIILGVSLLSLFNISIFIYGLPGLCGISGAVVGMNSAKNKKLLLISGIIYLVGAAINTIAIKDISIFGILSIIFGILNIKFSK